MHSSWFFLAKVDAVVVAEAELLAPQQGVEVAALERSSAVAHLGLLDEIAVHARVGADGLQHHLRLGLIAFGLLDLLSQQRPLRTLLLTSAVFEPITGCN
jgi:hypothetical protein